MNTHPNSSLKILQLLLRCGMVCQEELKVVIEMMPVPFRQPGGGDAGAGGAGARLRSSATAAGAEADIPTEHADTQL